MKKLLAICLMTMSVLVSAQNIGWRSSDGSPAADTDSMKSVQGFGGWLLVTPDQDWEQKWNTPSENVPSFNEAHDVKYGEELTILIFSPILDLGQKEIWKLLVIYG